MSLETELSPDYDADTYENLSVHASGVQAFGSEMPLDLLGALFRI